MGFTIFALLSLISFVSRASATRTVTVISRTGACVAGSGFTPYVTYYDVTEADGATRLTSSTVTAPQDTSVSQYTTTNSDGSTILTSTTITSSGSGSGSVTANPVRTSRRASSTASEAAAASPSAPCPQAPFAENYISHAGVTWQIFCSANAYYYDLPSVTTNTFEECIDACDAYEPSGSYNFPCVAVTWTQKTGSNTSNCLLKYGVSQVVYGTSNYCSAKLASYVLPPDFPVSLVSSYASEATPTQATTSLSYATGTQVTQYESASPCPLTNGSTYTVPDGSNVSYEVLCGVSFQYDDLPDIVVGSLEDCMAACNDYQPAPPGDPYDQPCIAVTYIGQNPQLPSCFRHYAINNNYVVNGSPYGDSAVRKDSSSGFGRVRQLQIRQDTFSGGLSHEILLARQQLASQGIDLIQIS